MKKNELIPLILLLCTLPLCAFLSFENQCAQVREQTVRLHVVANSDSSDDQNVKLLVRDAILAYTASSIGDSGKKTQALNNMQAQLEQIQAVADDVLRQNGKEYISAVYLTNEYFSTREYEGFTMPAGRYDALRIELGEADGRNWWCVAFPPLCYGSAAAPEPDTARQITGEITLIETTGMRPAFRTVELFEELRERFAN